MYTLYKGYMARLLAYLSVFACVLGFSLDHVGLPAPAAPVCPAYQQQPSCKQPVFPTQ